MVVFLLIALVISAVTGGLYYYQTSNTEVYNVQSQVSGNVVKYSDYLLKTVINSSEIFRILSMKYKDVIVEEKLRQVVDNNIVQIFNVRLSVKDSKIMKRIVYSFIIKNTISILPISILKNKEQQLSYAVKKEYTNSRDIGFVIYTPVIKKQSLIMPASILGLSKIKRRVTKHDFQKNAINVFNTTEIFTNLKGPTGESVALTGVQVGKNMGIYSTFSLINNFSKDLKNETFLFYIYEQLSELKNDIIKEQLEKIGVLPENITR